MPEPDNTASSPAPRRVAADRVLATAYAALAAAVFVWSFTPTYDDGFCCDRIPVTMGSLWLMQANHNLSVLPGTFALVVLTVGLGWTGRGLWTGSRAPAGIPAVAALAGGAYAAFLGGLTLTGAVKHPELTGYGHASIAITLAAVPLTAVHALLRLGRRLARPH